ncbi:pilus assembly protein TadG-related protein [Qipengyuania sp. CAU 1752]
MGIRTFFKKLGRSQSGNAALLVALGMPVLVGGTGYAVDTAQWYLWKRELQHAVDQAAIAGAWAKAEDPGGSGYIDRADREYQSNIELVDSFDSGATVTLEDYDGGTDNSVQVTASATGELAFSAYILGRATTVRATAVAIHEPAESWRPCLLALDSSAGKAVWFTGGPNVTAQCGVGALSDASDAISFDGGAGNYDLEFAITSGGVDDAHGHSSGDVVVEGMGDLADPHEGLTAPDNPTPRSLSCATASQNWTADETIRITTSYSYSQGPNPGSSTPITYSNPRQGSTSSTTETGVQFATEPTNSIATTTSSTQVGGRGNSKVWEKETRETAKSYANKVNNSAGNTNMRPGTYTSFVIACPTSLDPGVYVIDGGSLKLSATGASLTGSGVMFVLKNGASIDITGGRINLTAMTTVAQLTAVGVAADQAERMIGMLIFEDANSTSATGNKLNGNTNTVMNGVVYTPNSELSISGSMRGSSTCLELAAKTLKITGTANLTTLCPVNVTPTSNISTRESQVRLVA